MENDPLLCVGCYSAQSTCLDGHCCPECSHVTDEHLCPRDITNGELARLRSENAKLASALRSLANEATGFLSLALLDARETFGNTNIACLQLRIDEARAALEGEPNV